ncbi:MULTISPECIES: CDP-diacylglycerol--glycerol-3-phosphate 3-phosphatidyltransferase [Microbacterium]|jgi:CDP-diacylglycerol---glycerol-3-phosphate 3-phosphatidyltransferase|uniref:CDP-diacylglycerol--glycerol-3-phosphate 3-phosphatidyltransferase n=1 Tax=Microbacterium TaxID=33882 RepID=UPI002286B1C2|nr:MULTISPECIES: CDP-diacylglycerol--glycerol-3-phosphate 3-phosphatidyltransferase [Microbacterium]MCZ0708878.1 CDP-diacylglycerol--glycerol-3-phosphate 3-phosphatidyltransferase [Microbacterium paraoxydans]MDH5132709.1 CDP-diacylglycerol--glycerol-3-phosphate 3-phosphatidyltransferase [Microbacterium sp. RD10]MDH5136220.1 CDP-diacylglycerol--glycerol-3-phosphate 3-phosphatidyltransferase [Microbacterium sp. RD11]MDH5144923.1 CDP-diacylglycerol--glycerol-3-phosphate 3-phosphatidyltransferase [
MAIPRQLPNAITVARIPLAVVFFVLLLVGGTYGLTDLTVRWIAAVLFIVAISTDWVDGYLARRYDIVSDFGKLWDPIADKLLTGAGFVGLAILGEVSWWIVAVILVREWGITIHRLVVASEHVVAAAWMGKIKTAFQGVALGWALLPLHVFIGLGPWTVVTTVLMVIVLVLTVVSGIDYIVAQVRGARQSR